MNISITEELANFVKAKVQSGRYTSSSEVIREALRLLEKQDTDEQQKAQWLKEAYKIGLQSGEATRLDLNALKREGRGRLQKSTA
jgi:antitoxin ParD1/3/4